MTLDASLAPHLMILLMAAAFLAGWVDAVVGGGGLIQLPALLVGLPQNAPVATVAGTNKISSIAGTLTASMTYLRTIRVHLPSAAAVMAGAVLGSSAGARLVQFLPKRWFIPIVLVVLVGVGIFTWRRPSMGLVSRVRHHGLARYLRLAGTGVLIGIYDGAIGPGTGTFFVIALVGLIGYGFLEASALAKLANLATNAGAIAVFWAHGVIWWRVGLPMALANLAGGWIGARTAVRHGNAFVRRVFLVAVVGLGFKLAYDTVVAFH
ncbi:sulfite exporter TauE/SafE family protein [Acidipropionibacterium virtanenii]|uniref:Probable membrane transporter protein n=1 Tax=Acidipropionibacterium virtanenii TaxID=2057246 RepID=A0A344UT82_9ACTN|nr:hypothetical protein JS278_01304 [Acidipropionibacterium virtanenii]